MCTSHAPENVVVCDVALADVKRIAGALPGVTLTQGHDGVGRRDS
jgi:hypothetical protein